MAGSFEIVEIQKRGLEHHSPCVTKLQSYAFVPWLWLLLCQRCSELLMWTSWQRKQRIEQHVVGQPLLLRCYYLNQFCHCLGWYWERTVQVVRQPLLSWPYLGQLWHCLGCHWFHYSTSVGTKLQLVAIWWYFLRVLLMSTDDGQSRVWLRTNPGSVCMHSSCLFALL